MAQNEIERRFLVDQTKLDLSELQYHYIAQGYLPTDPANHVTRLRKVTIPRYKDNKGGVTLAYLTIKTHVSKGINREFEFEIPTDDANELLQNCEGVTLEKTRYLTSGKGRQGIDLTLKWEIDVFTGPLEGIIIAEIELPSLDVEIELPDFIGLEITGNKALSNFRMAKYPNVALAEIEYLLKMRV